MGGSYGDVAVAELTSGQYAQRVTTGGGEQDRIPPMKTLRVGRKISVFRG